MSEWRHLQRDRAELLGQELVLLVQKGLMAGYSQIMHMCGDDSFEGSIRVLATGNHQGEIELLHVLPEIGVVSSAMRVAHQPIHMLA